MAAILAVIGVTVSLGLIVVSAILNFRMGFRAADTAIDGYVYGAGAACGDALKAISPFMAFYGLKHRDWLAVAAAVAIYLIFTGYSFVAALGFAAEHRTSKAAGALSGIETRQHLRAELKRNRDIIEALGPQRSSREVEAAITVEAKRTIGPRNRTVDAISENCTLNRAATREACRTIATLGEELARAQQYETIGKAIDEIGTELSRQGRGGAADSEDPQVDAVKRVVGVVRSFENNQIGFGLNVLLAVFIELGSGLGLFVATTPWRNIPRSAPVAARPRQKGPVSDVGVVDVFVLNQLEPDASAEVKMPELYASYLQWCRKDEKIPHTKAEFKRQFREIARAVGMRNLLRNGQEHYQQVRLAKKTPG